jgi:hypothetical protein
LTLAHTKSPTWILKLIRAPFLQKINLLGKVKILKVYCVARKGDKNKFNEASKG